MDKCREEFEIFWIRRCEELEIKCVLTRSAIDGDYLYINANYAWIGWKASRESMKAIKLPKKEAHHVYDSHYDDGFADGYNESIKDCINQITSAGYKVE